MRPRSESSIGRRSRPTRRRCSITSVRCCVARSSSATLALPHARHLQQDADRRELLADVVVEVEPEPPALLLADRRLPAREAPQGVLAALQVVERASQRLLGDEAVGDVAARALDLGDRRRARRARRLAPTRTTARCRRCGPGWRSRCGRAAAAPAGSSPARARPILLVDVGKDVDAAGLHVLAPVAERAQVGVVGEEQPAARVGARDQLETRLDEAPIAGLAGLERPLGLLALGDVEPDRLELRIAPSASRIATASHSNQRQPTEASARGSRPRRGRAAAARRPWRRASPPDRPGVPTGRSVWPSIASSGTPTRRQIASFAKSSRPSRSVRVNTDLRRLDDAAVARFAFVERRLGAALLLLGRAPLRDVAPNGADADHLPCSSRIPLPAISNQRIPSVVVHWIGEGGIVSPAATCASVATMSRFSGWSVAKSKVERPTSARGRVAEESCRRLVHVREPALEVRRPEEVARVLGEVAVGVVRGLAARPTAARSRSRSSTPEAKRPRHALREAERDHPADHVTPTSSSGDDDTPRRGRASSQTAPVDRVQRELRPPSPDEEGGGARRQREEQGPEDLRRSAERRERPRDRDRQRRPRAR